MQGFEKKLAISATIKNRYNQVHNCSKHMDEVSLVRERTDIVALINSYVPLKKMGHNFKANCPFHGEKTPSFVVSPERQIWHCFGCGKGGDCFTFLMEYDHMEFPEALRFLAEKAGVTLTNQQKNSVPVSKKEQIYKLNVLASEFYHFLLTKHAVGKTALAYLRERKIKPQTIETYMVGFAPGSGAALVNYLLQKKKYKPEDLLEAGLATKRGSRLVDFFQGRLMFPLFDHRGNVIGFSGRVLQPTDFGGKYINTRETLVYHKGQVFFGLNSSKDAIKKHNKALIMEGEFDVIAAFQEGITNTVAIKGTALTEEQVHLLSRFCTTVALCLDSDSAGQEAMKRSLPILEKKGLTTTVVLIPGGKDPDEAIKTDPVAFKKAVKADVPAYEVLIEQVSKKYSTKTILGKKQIGDEVLPFLAHISNEIVKEHYLKLLAKTLDTSYEVLIKEMERILKKDVVKEKESVVFIHKDKRDREDILEEYLLALLIQHESPALLVKILSEFITDYEWVTLSYQKIVQLLLQRAENGAVFSSKEFLAHLPEELVSAFDHCFLLPLPQFATDDTYASEVKKIANDLFVLGLKRKIKAVTVEMAEYEKAGNEEKLAATQQTLSSLLAKLSQKEQN